MSGALADLPLKGLVIAEAVGPQSPQALVIAAGMCGKIAQDLGATVMRITSNAQSGLASEVDYFLNSGKQTLTVTDTGFLNAINDAAKSVDCFIADVGGHNEINGAFFVALAMSTDDPLGGSEFTVAARSGVLDMVGDPDQQPLRIGGHQLAYAGGLACYSALADLLTAKLCGQSPQSRRIDLLDIAVWLNWKSIGASSLGLPVPTRLGDAARWLIVPCKDGHLALVYRSSDWGKLTEILDDERLLDPKFETDALRMQNRAELNAIFNTAFMRFTRAEIRRISLENKLPLGPVSSLDELVEDEHMKARHFFQPFKNDSIRGVFPTLPVKWNGKTPVNGVSPSPPPDDAGARSIDQVKPLAGCKVLDLGIITAGAATSAILADLGADVIKIEGPTNPDPFRYWDGPVPDGTDPKVPPYFRMTNRGKRNLVLDLKSKEARTVFLDMVKTSDVVVENFRRGVLKSWGLGFEDLKLVNPDIILASISSQGETGPDSRYVSFGNTLEAMGGLASITGYEGGPPVVTGADFNYPDQVVAIFAASMIQTAWISRQRGGTGVHLDLSQRELTTFLCGDAMLANNNERKGNAQALVYLQDCFKSSDNDWIAITVREEDRQGLVQAGIGESRAEIHEWIATRSTDQVVAALRKHAIAVAKVLTGAEVLAEHTRSWSRAMVRGRDGLLVKGTLFDSNEMPTSLYRPAAQPGALSEKILNEFTHLEGEQLDQLMIRVGAKAIA